MNIDSVQPTAAIADACLRLGLPVRLLSPRLHAVGAEMRLAGPALPVRHYGSVDVFFDAMLEASAGEVLVIDNEGRMDEGCIGDLTVLEAMHYKMSGFLVWGCHRDTEELRRLQFPVFSIGRCPSGPQRLDPRRPEAPVHVDQQLIQRGDWVFADDDGALLVEGSRAQAVIKSAAAIVSTERAQAGRVRSGTSLHEQFRWDEFVRRRQDDPALTLRKHLQTIGGEIEV